VALAFMFAVFLPRPCPFYILDEVEAALDDGAAAAGARGAASG
jgi:chromosome segregation ATPase